MRGGRRPEASTARTGRGFQARGAVTPRPSDNRQRFAQRVISREALVARHALQAESADGARASAPPSGARADRRRPPRAARGTDLLDARDGLDPRRPAAPTAGMQPALSVMWHSFSTGRTGHALREAGIARH